MASDNIDTYGVLAGNIVNLNFGNSKITGDLGSFNPITGPGTASVSGSINIGASINSALVNASFIYSSIMGYTPDTIISAPDIGGLTFTPGVIQLSNIGGVTVSGATPQITLDGYGSYLFQIPNGGITTDPTLAPVFFNLINGALASDVYWAINGDVNLQTIGNTTSFAGTVLCQGNITAGVSSSSAGGLLAFASSPAGIVTLNQNLIVCRSSQIILDNISTDYINIETNLADNHAIRINAANANGGILITAGFGGIEIDTTNSISMNAGAASNLSTTLGNLALQSQPSLVNIDGGSGVNIGCDNNMANTIIPIITPVVNIGTSASSKTIDIGNSTGSTQVNINSGTGGINVNSNTGKTQIVSNNTSVDAIRLDTSGSTGGIFASTGSGGAILNTGTGKTQIISNNTSVDAVRFDTSGSSGGIFLAAGANGISIGNDGIAHPIVIGNTTGATNVIVQSGTGGVAIDAPSGSAINIGNNAGVGVNIGNSSSTTPVNIHSGTFGITIGNDANSGEIQMGNGSSGKTITIGNNNAGSKLITRWETGGWIKHQQNPIALQDSNVGLVATSDILTALFTGPISTPALTANRTLQLDSAANIISALVNAKDNDALDFSIVNVSTALDFNYSLLMGSGGTMIGNNVVYPTNNSVIGGTGTYIQSNSVLFRLVINVTSTSYIVYRIA